MLAPLPYASDTLTELARLLETEQMSDVVFELDRLARKVASIHQAREAKEAARVAQAVREIEDYERARSARELDAWVKKASVGEIQKLTGTF